MKIYIDQIPQDGLEISESCDPLSLDINRQDIKFTQPINLTAQVAKGCNNIVVQLKIEAVMQLECSRCLEAFVLPFSKAISLNFSLEHKKVIDLANNLREEIILSYPLKPLCQPDCLGFCPRCGQNLNKGKCKCSVKEV